MKPGLLFLFAVILIFSSSCQQRLYFADRANAPGLTEAMEAKLALSVKAQLNDGGDSMNNINGNGVGYGIDAAFSPVNHLGLIGSYRIIDRRVINERNWPSDDEFGGIFNGRRWELGAGYYNPFGRMGRMEIYGGYGNGSLTRAGYHFPERNFSTRYHRFFLQPSAGFGFDKFSLMGGARIAFQKYYNFQSTDSSLHYTIAHSSGNHYSIDNYTFCFIEPYISAEMGPRWFKVNIQTGWAGQISGPQIGGNLPFYFSFGFVLHLSPRLMNTPFRQKVFNPNSN